MTYTKLAIDFILNYIFIGVPQFTLVFLLIILLIGEDSFFYKKNVRELLTT